MTPTNELWHICTRYHKVSKSCDIYSSPPLDKMAAFFADDIFKCVFMNEKYCILIQISMKFVPKRPINN